MEVQQYLVSRNPMKGGIVEFGSILNDSSDEQQMYFE